MTQTKQNVTVGSGDVLPESKQGILSATAIVPPVVATGKAQAAALLDALRFDRGLIQVKCIKPGSDPRMFWYKSPAALLADWSGLDQVNREGYSVYFGAGTFKTKSGTKSNLAWLWTVHADLDAKDFVANPDDWQDGMALAASMLDNMPPSLHPAVVVDTGHGFHAYWPLADPLEATPENIARVEAVNRALVAYLGADKASVDASHVLRLPDFQNVKDPAAPCPVVLLGDVSPHRFTLDDFTPIMATVTPAAPITTPAAITATANGTGRAGDDFNTRGDWPTLLTAHGWTLVSQHDQASYWCRPGKVRAVSARLNWQGDGKLKVYTSNAPPLDPVVYTLFSAYTVLEHGGDFHAAAKALAALGYGTAPHTNGTGHAPDLPPIVYSDLDAPPEDLTEETILHMAATTRPARTDQAPTKKPSDRYATALATLGYTFRLNEANDEVEVNGQPMSDAMRATIRTDLRDVGLSKHLAAAEDFWTAAALKNAYHPFRSWLDGVQWDGKDHIARLATKYMHDMHDPITWPDGTRRSVIHTWLFHWLVGAVGKLYAADQNTMLVLDGAQDLGKSYFCHWLGNVAPSGYLESPLDPSDKDHDLRLLKHLVWEVSELGATTRKQDTEALKAFITKSVVTVRKPYGHHDIHKPAICSLVGTVNAADGFLTDPTGNRRFMVVTLDGIDWRYADQVDPAQVWATAYAAWKTGARGRLDEVAVTRRTELNAEHKVKDSMSVYFDQVVTFTGESYDYVEFGAVVAKLVALGYRGTQRAVEMALSSYLTGTGATVKRSAAGFRVFGFVLK